MNDKELRDKGLPLTAHLYELTAIDGDECRCLEATEAVEELLLRIELLEAKADLACALGDDSYKAWLSEKHRADEAEQALQLARPDVWKRLSELTASENRKHQALLDAEDRSTKLLAALQYAIRMLRDCNPEYAFTKWRTDEQVMADISAQLEARS